MKVLFWANHYKTIVFWKIAEILVDAGHEIYWISPSREWAEWLMRNGAERRFLLDLTDFGEDWMAGSKRAPSEEERDFIASVESQGLYLSNMILMDRMLSKKPPAYARAFLTVCGQKIKQFLIRHEIECVFSERTWATELMTVQLCEELNIANYNPQVIRIPDGRFAFFGGYSEAFMEPIREPGSEDLQQAEQFLDFFMNSGPKPRYFHLNNKVPRIKARWPVTLAKRIVRQRRYCYRYDVAQPTTSQFIHDRFTALFNSWSSRLGKPFEEPFAGRGPSKPYVLYALHRQPEASIDVLGGSISNQLELIRALTRSIPSTHDLYVKEHSNNIGNNSMKLYKQLLSIPGVRLISPYSDSHSLLKRADLVVTVSGTIAYEAGLFGIPAISVANLFFNPLLVRGNFNPYSDSIAEILHTARSSLPSYEDRVNFIARLLANSFQGIMSCPMEDIACIDKRNIEHLAYGFISLLDVLEGRHHSKPSAESFPSHTVDAACLSVASH
ncbi:hypothetical protein [Paenibacillus sp. SAFN-117]|uniref:hypothetical protein n=1 Tax=Paenibacillus sp. SAFN-117 TaxID=3436860 RepID=UPI003F7F68C0